MFVDLTMRGRERRISRFFEIFNGFQQVEPIDGNSQSLSDFAVFKKRMFCIANTPVNTLVRMSQSFTVRSWFEMIFPGSPRSSQPMDLILNKHFIRLAA